MTEEKFFKVTAPMRVENPNDELKSLIISFELEMDLNPNDFSFEIWAVNNLYKKGLNWKGILYREVISQVNKLLKKHARIWGDFEPIKVNYSFLSSCFWSPSFGFSLKIVEKKIKK